MSTRPIIFISAVSKELRSARDLVAKTLLSLGYEPKWQDIAPTETGMLPKVLRDWIDQSDAVLQLVGHHYGFAPKEPDAEFGQCSYTQLEALYARQQGKKVWYLILTSEHPTDPCAAEASALRELQDAYRTKVTSTAYLYHLSSSLDKTQLLVHGMKDELAELRKRGERHASLVIKLLNAISHGMGWLMRSLGQQTQVMAETQAAVTMLQDQATRTDQKVDSLLQRYKQMEQALIKLADAEMHAQPSGERLTPDQLRQRAYTLLEGELGIAAGTLANELPGFALELYSRPDTTLLMRARAAYALNKFKEAETLFLESEAQDAKAMENAEKVAGELRGKRIDAFIGAGQSAEAQICYPQAMEHYRAAAALTNQERDFLQWLKLQNLIGGLYHFQGHYLEGLEHARQVWETAQQAGQDEVSAVLMAHMRYASALDDNGEAAAAESEYRTVIGRQNRVLGATHPDTLGSRNNLGAALRAQGKYDQAEQEHLEVIRIQERVLGSEHPDTLGSRNNLAVVLRAQGKHAEAEQEQRKVLQIKSHVFGAEHPTTLKSRNNLANALNSQGKHAEAAQEHREVLAIKQRILGPEHPSTLSSRTNLASTLQLQNRLPEAEQEHRAVLKVQKRTLGEEHPATLTSRTNLATTLQSQGRYAEAEHEHQAVLSVQEHVLGVEHSDLAASCYNLALCLCMQKRLPGALSLMRRAEQVWAKHLGPNHPDTKNATVMRESIEDALK